MRNRAYAASGANPPVCTENLNPLDLNSEAWMDESSHNSAIIAPG